ncbi:hypothetical protein [Bradyrhizobium sp. USDA 3315]
MTETTADVLHLKSEEMSFPANTQRRAGGYASNLRLINPQNSTTLASGVAAYDGCSFDVTMKYDEVIVVLEGIFRIRTGENYSRVIEAKFGDVIWLPKGVRTKWEGDKAKIFYAAYPVDWRTRNEATAVIDAVDQHFHKDSLPDELITTCRVENWFACEVKALLDLVIAESGGRKLGLKEIRLPRNWFTAIYAEGPSDKEDTYNGVPVVVTSIEFDIIELVFLPA